MDKWTKIPQDGVIKKTAEALKGNGINVEVVENKEEAKKRILNLLPKGAEVMTMTSETLKSVGVLPEINESGSYNSVRNRLSSLDRKTQSPEMQKLGAAPEFVIGSVHAVTEDGKVLIASYTGSQFPAYAYGSSHVIWVIGAQKIVKDIDEGLKRIYEHVLPLESQRVKRINMMPQSAVNKLLIVNREFKQDRITIIIIKEVLGF